MLLIRTFQRRSPILSSRVALRSTLAPPLALKLDPIPTKPMLAQELSVRKSAAEVRKEGWLYRESGYVSGLVNPRYGAIYPHALVTFRSV